MTFYIFFLFFFLGFYLMFFYHHHYMLMLLGLELVLLSIFILLSYTMGGFLASWACFVFLLVLVCMGGYGVSLLVGVARCSGQDFWDLSSSA